MREENRRPILEVLDLSKTFKQKGQLLFALKHLSLTVEKGDIFGIIGLSGAGKSTLIRCLAGLIKPSGGKILFQDQDISQMSEEELSHFRKKIGMIFQQFNLLSSRTAAGNIAYPLEIGKFSKEEIEKRIDELLRLVGLSSKRDAHIANLSGGQKQRIGIARALANHPEVLFCDEATSALDPRTTGEILDLLRLVNRKLNLTIVLITHDMEVIKRICNKVAVIESGTIVESGTVSQVFSDPQHETTRNFIQKGFHEIPLDFFKPPSPNRKLLRIRFVGKSTTEPVISHIVKSYHLDANILLGWIDRLQTATIGTLIIELTGPADGIGEALLYLEKNSIHCEVLEQ